MGRANNGSCSFEGVSLDWTKEALNIPAWIPKAPRLSLECLSAETGMSVGKCLPRMQTWALGPVRRSPSLGTQRRSHVCCGKDQGQYEQTTWWHFHLLTCLSCHPSPQVINLLKGEQDPKPGPLLQACDREPSSELLPSNSEMQGQAQS